MTNDINLALVRFMYDRLGLDSYDEPFDYLSGKFAEVEGNNPAGGQTEYAEEAVKVFTAESSSIDKEEVLRYDRNIQNHLDTINEARESDLKLRYYQYLAVFFSEYYFDTLSSGSDVLRENFIEFLSTTFVGDSGGSPLAPTESDEMHKIAYWMATGSGKTYVAHINYLQFMHYFDEDRVDNTILVAPRENIARQHVEEFQENGIDAARINDREDADVLITDFGKLDEDASGPKTVDVEDWGSGNLVLVDEGHKGVGSMGNTLSTSWTSLRDTLAGDGYTIEYSATYGSSIKDDAGYQEYSTSIIFDYPYGRFHSDGYGKDYTILNIEASSEQRTTDDWDDKRMEWLLTNILVYYRKLKHFQEMPEKVEEYNIQKPLSVFVGGRVNAARKNQSATDIERVIQLFNRFIGDKEWAISTIERIKNRDVSFAGQGTIQSDLITFLQNTETEALYDDILRRLFDSEQGGKMELHRMKNDEGEIGITAPSSARYFGVVTIGDDKAFAERIDETYDDIDVREMDTFTGSLFERVDEEDSPIRCLIGSKKFSEGWDSLRPTNMGLLNLGRSKGPTTVQMFGRGVRVEGADKDGKRDQYARPHIKLLETLHVFGVRASYIETFKNSLSEERVNMDTLEVEVDVDSTGPDTDTDYYRPKTEMEVEDEIATTRLETIYNEYRVREPTLDLGMTVEQVEAGSSGVAEERSQSDTKEVDIFDEMRYNGQKVPADVLNWNRIHAAVLRHKQEDGYWPVIVTKEGLRQLFVEGKYNLKIEPSRLHASSPKELRRIEDICIDVGREWVDNAYDTLVSQAEKENIVMEEADDDWFEGVIPERFRIRFTEDPNIEEEIDDINTLEDIEDSSLSDALLNLAKHYYRPIAVSEDDQRTFVNTRLQDVHPEGINKGERKFIEELDELLNDLPDDLDEHIENAIALRNPSNTGIGFESAGGFYPDFVIWVNTKGGIQHIIFADPKGVLRGGKPEIKQKILFGKEIRDDINPEIDEDIELHSYIVARTDGSSRDAQDVINTWENDLRDEDGFDGSGEELLNNANVYLQDETTDDVPEKILRDALRRAGEQL